MILTVMETVTAVSFAVGPLIGGVFLQYTRFIYTFLIIGITSLLLGLTMLFILKSEKDNTIDKNTNWLTYIYNLKVIYSWLAILNGLIQISFFINILPLHLAQFQITPVAYGGIFCCMATFYAIATIFWSSLVEKVPFVEKYVTITGLICSPGLLFFVAPSTFVNTELNSPLILTIVLVSYYISVSTFSIQLFNLSKFVIEVGLTDNIATRSMVSSVGLVATTLGLVTGPPISGFLYEYRGFSDSTTIFAYIQLCLSSISITSYLILRKCNKL